MEEDNSELMLEAELSSATLAALREFQAANSAAADEAGDERSSDPFAEDWRMSQFWYDSTTAQLLGEVVMELSDNGRLRIACVACPSLFRELKTNHPEANVQLLEYDQRFAFFEGQFTFYDYNEPLAVPEALVHSFEVVVADPPYLSEECLEKTAETMKLLSRLPKSSPLILLTGAVQNERAQKHLGLRPCKFRPQHTRKLGNEFRVFTNFESKRLGGWDDEEEEEQEVKD